MGRLLSGRPEHAGIEPWLDETLERCHRQQHRNHDAAEKQNCEPLGRNHVLFLRVELRTLVVNVQGESYGADRAKEVQQKLSHLTSETAHNFLRAILEEEWRRQADLHRHAAGKHYLNISPRI